MVSRSLVDPGAGRFTVRTQSGVPRGAFLVKNDALSLPLGNRTKVAGRFARWGSMTGAIWL
jgi:hypothetical protein